MSILFYWRAHVQKNQGIPANNPRETAIWVTREKTSRTSQLNSAQIRESCMEETSDGDIIAVISNRDMVVWVKKVTNDHNIYIFKVDKIILKV